MRPEWIVLFEGHRCRVKRWLVSRCAYPIICQYYISNTHRHANTHTQYTYTHTKIHPTNLNSLLIFPHHVIKVPSCSSTWSPTAEKSRRRVREEKDQFEMICLYSLALSVSLTHTLSLFLSLFLSLSVSFSVSLSLCILSASQAASSISFMFEDGNLWEPTRGSLWSYLACQQLLFDFENMKSVKNRGIRQW